MCEVADLPDPVWNTLERVERPGGLIIEKSLCPHGGYRDNIREPAERHLRRRGSCL